MHSIIRLFIYLFIFYLCQKAGIQKQIHYNYVEKSGNKPKQIRKNYNTKRKNNADGNHSTNAAVNFKKRLLSSANAARCLLQGTCWSILARARAIVTDQRWIKHERWMSAGRGQDQRAVTDTDGTRFCSQRGGAGHEVKRTSSRPAPPRSTPV